MSERAASPEVLAIQPLARSRRARAAASVRVPGSKSLSNRHLALAAIAEGESTLRGVLSCDDCDRLVAALTACGVAIRAEGEALVVVGGGGRLPRGARVDLGDGGTPARFMLALSSCGGSESTIDGSPRLRERPIAEGVELLRALGAELSFAESPGRLPVRVRGGGLRGGAIEVGRTASSQFVSALMLVAATSEQGVDIRFTADATSASYLELSLSALCAHGVVAEVERRADGALARVAIARQAIHARSIEIEADASSAVYPAALAALAGWTCTLEGLPAASAQPDMFFLADLAARGARVAAGVDGHGFPATIVSGSERDAPLSARDADYEMAPDAAVMAMVLASMCDGPSRFEGLSTLRVKESDRIESVAAGLRALGGNVETRRDWVRVHPLAPTIVPATIDTANDHRLAMAFAILGLVRPGVSIANPGCVAKSWPGFWNTLDLIRAQVSGENDSADGTPESNA